MHKVKVVLITEESRLKAEVAGILAGADQVDLAGQAAAAAEALPLVEKKEADVALVDASITGDGYRLAESIALRCPQTAVVILVRELNEEAMHKAISAGAKEVLVYPFTPARLLDAVYHGYQNLQKSRQLYGPAAGEPGRKNRQGQLYAVFSTKGGVGKTFLACNLAVALAHETGARVVLADLDLDAGNAALALDLMPTYTIADVLNEITNLDRELLDSFLIRHPSGIALLASDTSPQIIEFVNAGHLETILKLLQSSFDFVVADMPSRFAGIFDPLFKLSDRLLLVTTPEMSSIRNLKACLDNLRSFNFPAAKTRLLLNKKGLSAAVKAKDVETTLGHPLYASLPVDFKPVTDSLNRGVPVVRLYPRSQISRSLRHLAKKMAADAPAG